MKRVKSTSIRNNSRLFPGAAKNADFREAVCEYENRIAELECEVSQLMALSKSPTMHLDNDRVQ